MEVQRHRTNLDFALGWIATIRSGPTISCKSILMGQVPVVPPNPFSTITNQRCHRVEVIETHQINQLRGKNCLFDGAKSGKQTRQRADSPRSEVTHQNV